MKLYRYITSDEPSVLPGFPKVDVVLLSFNVVKTTPGGFWIMVGNTRKWVSNNCRKRFAYPTLEDAMQNYQKRTDKYRRILSYRIKVLERALKLAEEGNIIEP